MAKKQLKFKWLKTNSEDWVKAYDSDGNRYMKRTKQKLGTDPTFVADSEADNVFWFRAPDELVSEETVAKATVQTTVEATISEDLVSELDELDWA